MSLDRSMTGTMQAARIYMRYSVEEFSGFLKDRYGVLYSDDLTAEQIQDLLEYLRLIGFRKNKRKWTCTLCKPRTRKTGDVSPVSPGQQVLLQTLIDRVKWSHEKAFKAWLSRCFGITDVATGDDASRLIVALKGLIRSQKKRCHGCTWQFDIEPDRFQAKEVNGK
ncbi:MAG: hypothetical protein KA801_06480 [Syntrophorhabdaceae bacterium]|nr:hypothetical protein [Syntrophorhabdaceae bacterium]